MGKFLDWTTGMTNSKAPKADVRRLERQFRDCAAQISELADGAYCQPYQLGFRGLTAPRIKEILDRLQGLVREAEAEAAKGGTR